MGAIHSVDTNHLITVGHNALHALLPSNGLLDFVSHHSYPSDAHLNSSCTAAQFYNVTAVPVSVTHAPTLHVANRFAQKVLSLHGCSIVVLSAETRTTCPTHAGLVSCVVLRARDCVLHNGGVG